ncbi:MAG: heme-degrading domain-containing protein [Propionicimonas sp.]|nr:heme-degrading domain-containing protein [Propionicimonas sp.]
MSMSTTELAERIAALEAEERELLLPSFSYEDAWTVGLRLRELAAEGGLPVAIDIRRGEQQLFHAALAGSSADNDSWLARKAAVVRRYDAASLLVGYRFEAKGREFNTDTQLPFQEFAAHGGAVPVRVRGVGLVGTAAVSGLAGHEDHALVVRALRELIG